MFRKLDNYYAIPVSNLNLNEFIDSIIDLYFVGT